MRILLINQYAGAPRYGMEYRPYHLAVEWRRLGHDVTIVGGNYSHLRFQNPPQTTVATAEDIDGVRFVWLPSPTYRGNNIGRARNILAFAVGVLRASGDL